MKKYGGEDGLDSDPSREIIYQKIITTLLTAPPVREAKRMIAKTLLPEHIDLTQPGWLSFQSEAGYLTALDIIDKLIPGLSPSDDAEHEIDHFNAGKSLGCDSHLCLVFGADNLKKDSSNYMSWDGLYCKTVTAAFRPYGLSDDDWNGYLAQIYDAPDHNSRGDNAVLKWLKRK